jgi:hypothetical protein
VEPYEWVSEQSRGYREFLVPAAIINAHATVTGADWTSEYEKAPEMTGATRPAVILLHGWVMPTAGRVSNRLDLRQSRLPLTPEQAASERAGR